MSVIPFEVENQSRLCQIKSVYLADGIPLVFIDALRRGWPSTSVRLVDEIAKADLQILMSDDGKYPDPGSNAVRLIVGMYDQASFNHADAWLWADSDAEQFLAQVCFLDTILRRKRYKDKTRRGVLSKLVNLQRRFDDLDHDLSKARDLQQSLLNQQTHSWDGGSLDFRIWPKAAIGGDLMGWFRAGSDHTGFFSIDVVGHGIASSLFCARIAGLFTGDGPNTNMALTKRRGGTFPRDPAKVIQELNALMFDHFDSEYYLTATLGFVDQRTNEVAFCQAGHTRPIQMAPDLSPHEIQVQGLPVGLVPGAEFETTYFSAKHGQRIVLYSDGISECQDQAGQDQYGDRRLFEFLSIHRTESAQKLLSGLYADTSAFGHLHDDACAMVLDFKASDKQPMPHGHH